MEMVLRLWMAVTRMIFRGAWGIGKAVTRGAANHSLGRNAKRAIAPGQHDYRGVVDGRRPPAVLTGEFPVGHFLSPSVGVRGPVGIPEPAVRHNACVIGPPGAGKTRYVIVPWIVAALRSGYSVVTIDVKGDMLDLVRAAVQGQPPLNVRARALDYTRPANSLRWSWLADLDSDRAIDSAVMSIVGKQPPPNTDPYFFHMDSQILRGLLELISGSPNRRSMTTSTVLRTLKDQALLDRTLSRYPNSPAIPRLADLMSLAPDDYSKRISGVSVKLDALARPAVEQVTRNPDFATPDVLSTHSLTSIVAPLQDGQLARTLSGLFVNDLLFRAFNRFTGHSGNRLLLVLDEAAQLADRIDFKNVLSVARSAGVAIVVAVQDVAQFADVNERSTVFGNCGTFVCFSGASPESAKLLSDRLGSHPVLSTSVGQTPGGLGYTTTVNQSTTMAPVLGQREIMNIPFGARPAVVHARDVLSAPFLVDFGA
ncbi:type IV secretory system conjugative DNA transfer family protein [Actinoplanes sp. NPDC051633]|uniref:type IV secretory system conjugative DNA transfer family protein n=1 Tax=Actinoplanes sp. NPDC051633 TaxID=3155670 RepID=UPI0034301C4D